MFFAQFDETKKQNMKEKLNNDEEERVKELESLRQRHADVVDEIDQVFVCVHYQSSVFALLYMSEYFIINIYSFVLFDKIVSSTYDNGLL